MHFRKLLRRMDLPSLLTFLQVQKLTNIAAKGGKVALIYESVFLVFHKLYLMLMRLK